MAFHRRFRASVRGDTATLYVYEEIGEWGIRAKDLADQLEELGKLKHINVRINSIGGDVFDGITMHNLLASHAADVTVDVDGMAASAASVIAMAGHPLRMASNSFMLIHSPWTVIGGDANDFRHVADQLEAVEGALIDTYVRARRVDRVKIEGWVAAETTMTAEQAVSVGMADEVTEPSAIAAKLDLSQWRFVPAALKDWQAAPLDQQPDRVRLEAARRERQLTMAGRWR